MYSRLPLWHAGLSCKRGNASQNTSCLYKGKWSLGSLGMISKRIDLIEPLLPYGESGDSTWTLCPFAALKIQL